MEKIIEKFEELRAQLGTTGIYVKKPSEVKFHLFAPTEEAPSFSGDTDSVEINVTTSTRKTKISGKETLNDAEFEIFNHRDNKALCEEYSGLPCEWLILDGDYSGEMAAGTMTWKSGNRTADDPSKITCKITPTKLISSFVKDAGDLIMETVKFDSEIPHTVELPKTTDTYEINIALDPTDGTFTATSESTAVATATVTGGKLTITGKTQGRTMVTLVTAKEGCASRTTTILVIVPAPTV